MSGATIKFNSSICSPSAGADQSPGFDRCAWPGGYEPPSLYGLAPDDYAPTLGCANPSRFCTRHPLAIAALRQVARRPSCVGLGEVWRSAPQRRPTPISRSTILRKFLLFDWWTQISD